MDTPRRSYRKLESLREEMDNLRRQLVITANQRDSAVRRLRYLEQIAEKAVGGDGQSRTIMTEEHRQLARRVAELENDLEVELATRETIGQGVQLLQRTSWTWLQSATITELLILVADLEQQVAALRLVTGDDLPTDSQWDGLEMEKVQRGTETMSTDWTSWESGISDYSSGVGESSTDSWYSSSDAATDSDDSSSDICSCSTRQTGSSTDADL